MAMLALLALSLQPTPADAGRPTDAQRETVIAAPENQAATNQNVPSRIRGRGQGDWLIEAVAATYLREWATCTVRNKRPLSVALLATPLNSPEQTEIVDQITGRRFGRRTVCARFRTMRVDNLVLRGAIAEALQRWEADRRRPAGALTSPARATGSGSMASLAQAGYCVIERQPEGVRRVMATRLGTQNSANAIEALREAVNDCLPGNLQATDFHPMQLRGALGEPYFLSRRAQRTGTVAVNPAT